MKKLLFLTWRGMGRSWTKLCNFSLIKMALDQRPIGNPNDQSLFYFGKVLNDTMYNSVICPQLCKISKLWECQNAKYTNEQS